MGMTWWYGLDRQAVGYLGPDGKWFFKTTGEAIGYRQDKWLFSARGTLIGYFDDEGKQIYDNLGKPLGYIVTRSARR
jgi:hypothetical protein